MGFLDNLSAALDKGVAGASRMADTASLKMKVVDTDRRRKEALVNLGEAVVADPAVVEALTPEFKDLFSAVFDCDAEKRQLQEEIAAIEEQVAQEKAQSAAEASRTAAPMGAAVVGSPAGSNAPVSYVCSSCGAPVAQGAQFCSNCGKAIVFGPAGE